MEENKQNKRHASIAIIVENAEQAKAALQKKFLYIADSQLEVIKFKFNTKNTQCQKCQRIGHITKFALVKTTVKSVLQNTILDNISAIFVIQKV